MPPLQPTHGPHLDEQQTRRWVQQEIRVQHAFGYDPLQTVVLDVGGGKHVSDGVPLHMHVRLRQMELDEQFPAMHGISDVHAVVVHHEKPLVALVRIEDQEEDSKR